ncbi:MAG: hypothetical protein V3U98_10210 [Acidobacteriota bacterium]
MKRREAIRKIAAASAAAALGRGLAISGNIAPEQRRYGAPATLQLQRSGEENLLRLALARQEVPTGVWDEMSALARLAAAVARSPERARAFARDPGAAFRSVGYDLEALRLDAVEIQAVLLLADEEVQEAISNGDALRFVRALRELGVGPNPDHSELREAFRQAVEREAELGLRPLINGDSLTDTVSSQVVVAVVLAFVVAIVAAAVVAAVLVLVYTAISVSGSGGFKRRRSTDNTSLIDLAALSGNRQLAREVRESVLDEAVAVLTEAALEAAEVHGVQLAPDEAERHLRLALTRMIDY